MISKTSRREFWLMGVVVFVVLGSGLLALMTQPGLAQDPQPSEEE